MASLLLTDSTQNVSLFLPFAVTIGGLILGYLLCRADQLSDTRTPEQQKQDAITDAEEVAREAAIQWLEDHPKL
jgi:hypothetical protein